MFQTGERGQLTRRALLRAAVATSAAAFVPGWMRIGRGAADPSGSVWRTVQGAVGIREIRLVAALTPWELLPGRRVAALTYNGQVPGPLIRLREGERLRIVVDNRLPQDTTVHWHGVDVPFPMDGVPGLTQEPIRPGETFIYEFEARPAGTRWYHTHAHGAHQLDGGLYGPLIIEPRADVERVDRDYTLMLGSWATGLAARVPDDTRHGAGGGTTGGMGDMMRGMPPMMGIQGPPYDTFSINGKAFPATAPLGVRKGERIRLRLFNASAHRHFDVRLDGHVLRITHTDGHPLANPVPVDALSIAPAERYDVEFVADRPGKWAFRAVDDAVAAAGLQAFIVYEGYETAPPSRDDRPPASWQWWSYPVGRGQDVLPSATGVRRRYTLTLGWGMMMRPDLWTINGRAYPNTEPLRAAIGDLVVARIVNMSPDSHPMHLHGQSFRVTSINGSPLPSPLVKDTIDVDSMGSVDLEIVAYNLGRWFFHCHKTQHMDGGMVTLLEVQ